MTGPTSGPGDYYQYKKAKEYLDKRNSGGGGSVKDNSGGGGSVKDNSGGGGSVKGNSGGGGSVKGNSGGGGFKKILGIILGIIVFLIALGILSNS